MKALITSCVLSLSFLSAQASFQASYLASPKATQLTELQMLSIQQELEALFFKDPLFRRQFGFVRTHGNGAFCERESVAFGNAQVVVKEAWVDFDEDFNTILELTLGDFDVSGDYYRRSGLCFWYGGGGKVLLGEMRAKILLRIQPEQGFPYPHLQNFSIHDLQILDVQTDVPGLWWLRGTAPQGLNRFLESNINRFSALILNSWLGRRLERFLADEVKRRIDEHVRELDRRLLLD